MSLVQGFRRHKYEFLFHLVFWWSGVLFVTLFLSNNVVLGHTWSLIDAPLGLLLHLTSFYINWAVLVPKLLSRDKLGRYFLAMLALVAVMVCLRLMADLLLSFSLGTDLSDGHFRDQVVTFTGATLLMIMVSAAFRIPIDLIVSERRRKELELEKAKAELAFLKSQINPHFLFNTLNSLYALAHKQSAETPNAVLKLSELMRYMLYETNDGGKVELAKEVEYLQNYIDLQKLRLANSTGVSFETIGNLDGQLIEPMLLIPLVENVFKHGLAEQGAGIHIALQIQNNELEFRTVNPAKRSTAITEEAGGIGLQNIRRRLEMLYPGKHTFTADEQNGIFITRLHVILR